MNEKKIASIKENQTRQISTNVLEENGIKYIEEIITNREKKTQAIQKFKTEIKQDDNSKNYLSILSDVILENVDEYFKKSSEKLEIAKIRGDGWCQFHSIIYQLLQNKNLLELLSENYNKKDYRNFIEDPLRPKIINFINKLKSKEYDTYDTLNLTQKDNLVVDLLNIMITFVNENGDTETYECGDDQAGKGEVVSFTQKIWMDMFIKDDQNRLTLDEFDDELIKDAFSQFYTPDVNAKGDQWGGDITLTLIQFIFDLNIETYHNSILSKPVKRKKLYKEDSSNECKTSEHTISLLYSNSNHYDSVRKKQVTPN